MKFSLTALIFFASSFYTLGKRYGIQTNSCKINLQGQSRLVGNRNLSGASGLTSSSSVCAKARMSGEMSLHCFKLTNKSFCLQTFRNDLELV